MKRLIGVCPINYYDTNRRLVKYNTHKLNLSARGNPWTRAPLFRSLFIKYKIPDLLRVLGSSICFPKFTNVTRASSHLISHRIPIIHINVREFSAPHELVHWLWLHISHARNSLGRNMTNSMLLPRGSCKCPKFHVQRVIEHINPNTHFHILSSTKTTTLRVHSLNNCTVADNAVFFIYIVCDYMFSMVWLWNRCDDQHETPLCDTFLAIRLDRQSAYRFTINNAYTYRTIVTNGLFDVFYVYGDGCGDDDAYTPVANLW